MPETANSIGIGDLTAGVEFVIDEAALKRKLDQAEKGLTKKIQIPVEAQIGAAAAGLKDVEAQLGKVKAAARSAAQEQIQADKTRAASARAAAAESAASAAKIREQQAQLALSTRLSAQAEREAAQATRDAARIAAETRRQAAADVRAQAQAARASAQAQRDADRLASQAAREAARTRNEAINQQVLAYANLRKELNANRLSEADFNRGGDKIIATLQAMAQQAGYTSKELKRLTDLEDRVGREQNTLAGVINPVGFSGNMVAGLQSSLPGILRGLQQISAASPSLGAASSFLGTLETAMNGAGTASKFLGGAATSAEGAVAGMGAASGVAAGVVGGVLVMGLVAAAGAMNKAADEAGRLQFEMAKVSTLTDKFPSQLGAAGREVLNISRELGMSYQDIAEGLNKAIGASVRGTEDMAQALEFTQAAGKLAVAGNTSTAASVDLLSSVMNAYKLSAGDTTKVSDGLFAAIRDGKMEVNELTQSMGNVTAISADLGVPLQTVNAALATMTANGIKTSSAVDYLRSMLSSIQKPSSEAATLADNLGLKFNAQALASKGLVKFLQDVIVATKGNKEQMAILFGGVEALSAVTSIASGNFERMTTNLNNQARAAGSTEVAYQKMMGTLKKENDKFDANWKSLWANLGEYLVPFKTEFMSFMNDALEKLNLFLQKTNAARNATKAQENVDQLKSELSNRLDPKNPLGKPAILENLARAKESGVQAVIDNWTRKLAQVDNEIITLRGKIKEAETAAAQARADQTAALGPQLGPNMPVGNVLQDVGVKGRPITQQFGITANSQAMKGKPGYEDGSHKGLDIGVKAGTQLYSPNDVRILAAKTGWNDGLGTFVKMVDEQGNTILMAHLSKLSEEAKKAVKSGASLKKGTLVGLSGNTGQSTGDHLHLEMRDSRGRVFNPLTYGTDATPTGTAPTSSSGSSGDGGPVTSAMLARARELNTLMEKAQKAAQAKPGDDKLALAYGKAKKALEGWTEANDAHAEAMDIVRGTQEKATRSTQDYVATVKDVQKYGNDALRLYKNLEAAQKGGNSQEIADAETALNTWLGSSKVKKAVLEDEKKAYEARQAAAKKADTDAETAAKNRAKTQQDLQAALSKGREEDAQRLLTQLKTQQAKELDLARDSAAKRAQITAQSGPAIIAAENKLAAIRRDRAVAAAKQAAKEALALPGADPKAVEAARVEAVRQAYATEKQERDRARADQASAETQANRTALQAQQQHEKERKRLIAQAAQEARELRYQESDATLNRIKSNNKAELDAFAGSVDERLQLIKRQTQAEYEAAEKVARIKRDNALRDSANKGGTNQAARDARIKQDYTDYVEGLKNTRIATVREATKAADDYWKAALKDADQYKEVEDHWTRLKEGAKSAGGAVSSFVLSIEDAVSGLPEATDAQADYLAGLKLLEQNGTAAAGAVDAVTAAIEQKGKAERQAVQDASDLEMLDIFGGGTEGLKRVFDAFGVSGIDQLKLIDSEAAAQVERVFKSTLLQMQADLEKQAEAGYAVLENFKADSAALADQVEQDADQALADKNAFDAARVRQMAASGPDTLFKFLNKPGQMFGDSYWLTLGAEGREKFMEAFGAFTPEDFGFLGEDGLTGMLEKIPDDPAWDAIHAKLTEALALAVATRQEVDTILADVYAHPDDYADGGRGRTPAPAREKANAYNDQMARVYEMDRNGDLFEPAKVTAYTAALNTLADQGDLTATELQVLLDTIKQLQDGVEEGSSKPLSLSEWQDQVSTLTAQFDAGEVSAQDYSEGLKGIAAEMEALAVSAEKAGNPQLAQAYRDMAQQFKAMTPEMAVLLKNFDKLQQYGEWAMQALGALGKLTQAMAEGEQQYDKTGKALNTPWTDLSANIEGAQKAIQLALDMSKDIAKIAASGGADIGAWISLATKVISAIADALSGFKKAYAEAQRLRDEFAASNPLLNPTDFQKVSVQSRGFLADIFVGPKVVNEIDKVRLPIAQSLAEGVMNGMKTGFQKFLDTGDWAGFEKSLADSVSSAFKAAMVDGFMNDPARQGEWAAAIKEMSDAIASKDPERIAAAQERIAAATRKTSEEAKIWAEQMDAIDKKNGTGRYSPEATLARERRDGLDRLTNGQSGLDLQRDQGLITQRQYEEQSLALTRQRLKIQMEEELAAEGLTEEQKAAIREKYRLENEQAEFDASQRIIAAEREAALKLSEAKLGNDELKNEVLYRQGLRSKEDYEKEKLRLTLARLKAEMEAELLAAGASEALKTEVRERYKLLEQQAQLDFQDSLNAGLGSTVSTAADLGQDAAKAYASAFGGAFQTYMGGGSIRDKVRKQMGDVLAGAVDNLMQKKIGAVLAPIVDPLLSDIESEALLGRVNLDMSGFAQLNTTLDGLDSSLVPQFQGLRDTISKFFPEVAGSVDGLNDTLKNKQFQNTVAVTYSSTSTAPGDFAAQIAYL